MSTFVPEIDLHYAHPSQTKELVLELIEKALQQEIKTVRIVHGKGKSIKKLEVYKILELHPRVYGYDDDNGNWGATIVELE